MIESITELAQRYTYAFCCVYFVVGLVNDYIYARYMIAVADRKPFAAANWSLVFTLLWLVFALSIVEKSVPLISSYLVGGYLGTYFAVKFSAPK
jgi:hypothetical protein